MILTSMWFPKTKTNEETKVRDTENRLAVPRGKEIWEG